MANDRDNIRGIAQNQEINPSVTWRDPRNLRQKFSDFISDPSSFVTVMFVITAMFLIIPAFGELYIFPALWLIWYASKKEFRLPFRIPQTSNLLDPGQPNPGNGKPSPAEGIGYFGNEKKTGKELWFNNSDMRTHILIFGSTGAGKALRMNELVHTPDGWKKNKDLKVGDHVSTPSGSSHIIGVYPQGELDLYKINFEDGRQIEVSGDHLWEIHHKNWKKQQLDKNTFSRAKVITTIELMEYLKKDKVNKNFYTVLSKEVEKPIANLSISPYLLGALLGDGCLTYNKRTLKFSSKDIEIIDKLNLLLPKDCELVQLNSDKVYDYHIRFKDGFKSFGRNEDGSYKKRLLTQLLFNENLLGCDSSNKFIPEKYKNCSIAQRYQLIQGLMDTDGCAYKGRVEYTTCSKQLSEDVAEVIRSLGGIVKITSRITSYTYLEEKRNGQLSYRLSVKHPEPHKLFSLERKLAHVQTYQYKDTLKLKIYSVEKTQTKEDCQCIKIADSRGLFITKDYIVTHNTEALLSLGYNALVQGSGLIYVDGKGENVLFTKVFAMARTMGREDDLLVINYMTGAKDVFGPQEKKLSNTLNPFSSGSSGGLTELMVSLMDGGDGGGDMWKGRAISLISAIMMALVYMRDQKEVLLDVEAIREYLILDNIIKLYKTRRDFPNHIRGALRAYLVSLPGFQESAPKQNDTVLEQHGYLQMQFTKLLGSLSDSYGFIFKTNLGEVDFKDVVLNRRILVVLLPALEKSTDELANLGKIIVACLKQMMAAALGATIEGSYADVVETKPTNAAMPFMTILDEYGYYAVKGSAVMPAQARSLGFCMIFAGQDLPAFEKASKEEAASIIANCNIKICMKLEDPKDTYELFEKSAGEALVSNVGVLEMNTGGFSTTFRPGTNASVESRKRINILDLKEQEAGDAHILFKSAVIRAKMFYASPPQPPHIRMNYFVRVEPPNIQDITEMDNGLKSLIKNLTNPNKIKELEEGLEFDNQNIEKMRELLNSHSELGANEAAFATVAALGSEVFDNYDEKISQFREQLENDEDDEDEDDDSIGIFSSDKERDKFIKDRYKAINKDEEEDEDEDEEDADAEFDDEDLNVFIDEDETRKGFENIEKMVGASDEEAKESASRAVEDMKKISKYPGGGMPVTKAPEEITDILNELDEMFDMEEDEEDENA